MSMYSNLKVLGCEMLTRKAGVTKGKFLFITFTTIFLFTYNDISVRLHFTPDDTNDIAALLVLQVVVHY